MKFFVITDGDSGSCISRRLIAEGHDVSVFYKNRRDNLPASIPEGLKLGPDIVIFDVVDDDLLPRRVRDNGVLTVGGDAMNNRMATVRAFTFDYASRVGVRFLPEGNCHGYELHTQIWFSDGVPVTKPIGITTRDSTVGHVWNYRTREPRIIQLTLKKMFPGLKAIRYTGPLTVSSCVDGTGKALVTNITPRFVFMEYVADFIKDGMGAMFAQLARRQTEAVALLDGCIYGHEINLLLSMLPSLRRLGYEVPVRTRNAVGMG